MQGPVARAVLKNDEREERAFGDVVVASLAHGNLFVEIVAAEKRLAQLADISFALQADAELLADGAGAAVAADEIRGANRFVARRHSFGRWRSRSASCVKPTSSQPKRTVTVGSVSTIDRSSGSSVYCEISW